VQRYCFYFEYPKFYFKNPFFYRLPEHYPTPYQAQKKNEEAGAN
jgi:hypothetical protein